MKVSVIIPLYNKTSHIARALDSVLSQTFGDFEVIVVDDGSTDRGADIVRRYTDPRIRLITQSNQGVSAARNRGSQMAASEWLAFLDADDEWSPRFIETVLALHDRFPDAAVCATGYRLAKPDGSVCNPRLHGRLPTNPAGGKIDYCDGPSGFSPLTSSSVLINKAALHQAGGFPVGVVYGEDTDTWLRLALRYPIAWSPSIGAIVHEDAENRTAGRSYVGNFPFFSSVRTCIEKSEMTTPLPRGLYDYLARKHTGLLAANWLIGNTSVVREITSDCGQIPGVRCKCILWNLLSHIPRTWATVLWRLWRLLAFRKGALPCFGSIYRPPSQPLPYKRALWADNSRSESA